jgi:hypothetical protein
MGHAQALTAVAMHGRGYVQNGREEASAYIQNAFKELGLQPAPGSTGFTQPYYFPINTFPGRMQLMVNGKELVPGQDYLIDAAAASFNGRKLEVSTMDMATVTDLDGLKKALKHMNGSQAWLLLHTDSMCKALGAGMEEIATVLPEGCYLVPQTAKLTWTASSTASKATVFYVKAAALPEKVSEVTVGVQAQFMPKSRNENIIATVPGTVKDTFIAITGHFDHLGMMGSQTMFPGASDNASGIAMLLYLASYFASHPQRYSVLFICFSGEEVGLLGSEYYVAHPAVPLGAIKFLTNIDIMGDATDGVTVVNATEFSRQFSLLQHINAQQHYLPVINSRGKAHNSDHYHFTEAGVPSFFMYSCGGKGYYHDIYDKADELTLNHVAGVAHLLIDFVAELQ